MNKKNKVENIHLDKNNEEEVLIQESKTSNLNRFIGQIDNKPPTEQSIKIASKVLKIVNAENGKVRFVDNLSLITVIGDPTNTKEETEKLKNIFMTTPQMQIEGKLVTFWSGTEEETNNRIEYALYGRHRISHHD